MDTRREQSLFREEAIREQSRRLEGSVVFAQPASARVALPLLGLLLIGMAAFLTMANYARTESVSGYVAPSMGVSAITPPRAGVVTRLAVAAGDQVEAGDLLMEVSSGLALASGAELESELRQALLRQRSELEANVRATQEQFEQDQEQRARRLAGLAQRIAQLAEVTRLAAERAAITDDRRERFSRLLAKGFASRDQYQAKLDDALGVQRELRNLELNQLDLEAERSALQAEIATAPRQHEEKQSGLRMSLAELEGRLRENEIRSSYAIQAPVAGRVASLQAQPGTAIAPDRPVAVIMPAGGRLEVQLLIPTRAAGMIEIGQSVAIQYAAFPHEKFGIGRGQITDIETAVLAPGELRGPVRVEEPVYRVTAAIDSQEVRAFGRAYPLQPGMLLNAKIVLEERSLLEWIFEPLYSLRAAPQIASAS